MRATRSTFVLLVAVTTMLGGWVALVAAKPVTTLADGRTGTIEFQTLTLSAEQFAAAWKEGPPVVISGDLTLPRGDGRFPALILSHGGGGISGAETGWVRELRSMGVVTFLVDSFSGRGIKRGPSEAELSRVGQVLDVYRALELLVTHPRVDPGRIALMGLSRGGGLTVLASLTRYRRAQLREGLDFVGYLAFYPTLILGFDYSPLSERPLRIFTGTLDESIPIDRARQFAERARSAGADVRLIEYEGAYHSFDDPQIRRPTTVSRGVRFTVAYHPQAHAKSIEDVKEALATIFGAR